MSWMSSSKTIDGIHHETQPGLTFLGLSSESMVTSMTVHNSSRSWLLRLNGHPWMVMRSIHIASDHPRKVYDSIAIGVERVCVVSDEAFDLTRPSAEGRRRAPRESSRRMPCALPRA